MDTEKCRALLYAVDTGSFTAAAEALGYTPSGIARMVNALEAEFGFALLSRTPRGVAPTTNGEKLLPMLRETVRCSEHAMQLGAELSGLNIGRLSIGTYYSVAACWLPEILRDFCHDFPNIQIETLEGGNSDLLQWLTERRVDCCFCSERDFPADWIPLKRDPLVVWLPLDHPRATSPAFPLNELNGAPFIETLPGCGTDLERLLVQNGLTPDVRFSTKDNYTTYAMVAAGLGISMNNELMAKNWSDAVAVLPFDPPQFITLGIAVPALNHASPALKKLISYAKRICL